MAKDVDVALQDILMEYKGSSSHSIEHREDAIRILNDMKLRRRYVLDIWS